MLFSPSPPTLINNLRTVAHEDLNDRHLAASSLLLLNNPVSPNTESRHVASESLLSLHIPTSQDTLSPPRVMHNWSIESRFSTPPRSSFSFLDAPFIELQNIQVSFDSPNIKQMAIHYKKNQNKKHRPKPPQLNTFFKLTSDSVLLWVRYEADTNLSDENIIPNKNSGSRYKLYYSNFFKKRARNRKCQVVSLREQDLIFS